MGGSCNKSIKGKSNKKQDPIKPHQDKKSSIEKNDVKKSSNNTKPFENMDDIGNKTSGNLNLEEEDSDFNVIENTFKDHLNSIEISNSEKLRLALKIFRELIPEQDDREEENKKLSRNSKLPVYVENLFRLIERHYQKLCAGFEKTNETYKPLIKILQIFELFVDNFNDKNARKEILDRIYFKFLIEKKMIIEDWRFLRKFCEQRKKEELEIFASWGLELVQGFYRKIKMTQKALVWKDETEGTKYAREIIDFILTLNKESLFEFLLMGRFDKRKTKMNESFSMIVGDEGGIFLLINKVFPGSRQEKLILNSGVSREFLKEKRNEDNKVILGKGAFGKVRLALSVLGSLKVDIGQLICVKKSLPIVQIGENKIPNKTNFLIEIADSTLEDFFAIKLNDSIHTPKPVDMAILNSNLNEKEHRKGYLFMELVPENTADKIFGEKFYQKWEYQKPYILSVLKTTKFMLENDGVFNSDLKPPNTLFDPISRKMAIIDLGSSLMIKKGQNLEKFDASAGGFGASLPYSPPEITSDDTNVNQLEELNLRKAISYLCGVTMAEVTCIVPADKQSKNCFECWSLTAEKTNLDGDSKGNLIEILKSLTNNNPANRMDISDAISRVEKIGLNADEIMKKATSEHYMQRLKELIKENPCVLSLNEDINEMREKGIIKQMVVESNPKRHKNQKTKEFNKELDDFLSNTVKGELFVLLGEAGSGKSLALQLRFIEEVQGWQYGKNALPLFFNMADEVNLEKVVNRLNAMLGCNIKLDDPNSDDLHLFIDSYDEGHPGDDIKSEQEGEREVGKYEKEKAFQKKVSLIEQYFENLSKWRNPKLVISCRTDFVQREGDDNLSEFQVRDVSTVRVRYIAPVDYQNAVPNAYEQKDSQNENEDNFFVQVRDWLNREKRKEEPEVIIRIIKRLSLEGQMRTGLMFNMIMKMTLKMQLENISDLRVKGFEIYRRTIGEEFRLNWAKIVRGGKGTGDKKSAKEKEQFKSKKEEIPNKINEEDEVLSGKGSHDKESDKEKEKFKEIKEVIQKKLELDDDDKEDKKFTEKNGFEVIWEGMERFGELIATEMSLTKSNRISYSKFERLLLEQTVNQKDDDFDLDVRTEWKTLYQILRIMGLKLEKRSIIITKHNDKKGQRNILADESIIDIGFRHETYKNYYLLRGFKRLLPLILRDMSTDDSVIKKGSNDAEKIQSKKIVAALLEEEGLVSNYELLRFCGEEILNYKDPSLREGLRKMLSFEQKNRREGKMNGNQKPSPTSSGCTFEDDLKTIPKISRAAGVISLLVAGSYQFLGEDLGDLDLARAYM